MFCCLVINPNMLWSGPSDVFLRGGGIGVVLLILIFVRSTRDVEISYVSLAHVKHLLKNVTDMLSCRSARYQGLECVSLYDDIECKEIYGSDYYHMRNGCTNAAQTKRYSTAAQLYFQQFMSESLSRTGGLMFNVDAMFYYFIVFVIYGIISLVGERILRILLAIVYIGFLICLLISLVMFVSSVDNVIAAQIFWTISTPESIYSYSMYKEAFCEALRNCGATFYGIMSAASFRSKNKSTYEVRTS
ncbi:hypothetical protein DICVIV_02991 [Dictyocaulus viviparus]|uniref:Uncharacterized protein n=1 Tax=Dictyocaulus viviparus TaxID=29172 RepID=A0A0D8Y8D9_DICVI|nr:hypothetical protein DICVIV_02991 [Dictyocaulus viviparus]